MSSKSQDTEITLGTGKLLVLFFGLVALCAVFFGLGFSLGKNSVKPFMATETAPAGTAAGVRPSAVKANGPATPDLTFYKTVGQKDSDTKLATTEAPVAKAADSPAPAQTESKPADPMAAPSLNGYYVQVAAVTKQEDAESLVEALKKKAYPAFSTNSTSTDKFFHVQLGPYSDIKEAEAMRAKLVADGYTPILKK